MSTLKAGPRGLKGRGGGYWRVLPTPPMFRGTSVQVCGLWPFAGGSARPAYGVPVGADIHTGTTVACDAFSYFDAGLISSASMAVFGLPGYGKSSFTVRQIIGLAAKGVRPIVAGDLKGEYTPLIRALGGTVLTFDESFRYNVLDMGAMAEAAERIGGRRGGELRGEAQGRATTIVRTLIEISRHSPVADFEHSILSAGIRILHERHADQDPPTLPDLLALVTQPTNELLSLAQAADSEEYRVETRALTRSLRAVLDGPLGRTFSGQSTERLSLNAPAVSIDLSSIYRQSNEVLAAVMFSTWSEVFASIEAAKAMADAGVAPQRHFVTVMDEMWRAMRLRGAGLIQSMDEITRLNRHEGTGNIFITHSLKDMESIAAPEDVATARGFAERSGIVVTAALAEEDLRKLSEVKRMSEREIRTVARWSTPAGWKSQVNLDPVTGARRPGVPPDAGKVLIKVGERTGIPTEVRRTRLERQLHDTNARWVQDTTE